MGDATGQVMGSCSLGVKRSPGHRGVLCWSSLEKWPLLFPRARRVGEEVAAGVARALTRPLPSSCNLTCPPGRYGANCAEACSCHDGACDPLTGACHMGECQRARVGAPGSAAGLTPGLSQPVLSCRGQPADGGHRGRSPPGAAAHPPALPALLLLRLPQEGRSPRVSAGAGRALAGLCHEA